MAELPNERTVRLDKLNRYQAQHGSAFPARSQRSHTTQQVLTNFNQLTGQPLTLAGRIRFWRQHGKLTFAQLADATGQIQLAFSLEQLGQKAYTDLDYYDVGDIVQVTGEIFTTKAGERSVLVQTIRLLSKAIQPLPDKWHGLQDDELRLRKRYLELLQEPDLRQLFIKKAIFWNAMRTFLLGEGFLEVETPVLENTAGGADAKPFVTHHNALDIDLYLRISMGELWQKRLMVGGFEKTFEIGRQFRNEGISPEHLQDYTQMEFYWAYADYTQAMQLVERLYKHVIMETFGTLQFNSHGYQVNFDQTWPQLDYSTALRKKFGIDCVNATVNQLHELCVQWQVTVPLGADRGRLIDSLWKLCRKDITGPVFLINHPVVVSPLAKRKSDQPDLVERFQIICAGSELGNGYSELNDPIDQRERFATQAQLRAAGDEEAQMTDQDFVEALEYGMPPTTGFGVSERLFSFLANRPIRECVLFPLLRPKPGVTEDTETPQSDNIIDDDITQHEFEAGISRSEALAWLQDEIKDPNLQRHMLATEALMRALAKHFAVPAVEAWGIAGLLHDIDWEKTEPAQHSLVGADWLAQRGLHPEIVNAVREHNYHHGLAPRTLLSKALMCLEQLTGLITAVALVRPDKSLANVAVSSIKKKLKDKAFAKGVDRTMLAQCETLIGLPLDQAISLCLEAMQAIASELNLP